MNRIIRLILAFAVVLTLVGYASACNTSSAAPAASLLPETAVRTLADPVAENMLSAMNTGNYTAYTRDFTERLKKTLPEGAFQHANDARIKTVGTYVSKQYWRMAQKNDSLNVAYQAKFTDEPSGVLFTVFFKYVNGNWVVDGFYYDSPLMRSSDC